MLNVYHSKLMIFSEERNPEIFFGRIAEFSTGLLISCLLQILSVCSRFSTQRSLKNVIKMAVDQQDIELSKLRAILTHFITKIDINKRTDTEKCSLQLLQY